MTCSLERIGSGAQGAGPRRHCRSQIARQVGKNATSTAADCGGGSPCWERLSGRNRAKATPFGDRELSGSTGLHLGQSSDGVLDAA